MTAELESYCLLGESQLLWTINIYITAVSWRNKSELQTNTESNSAELCTCVCVYTAARTVRFLSSLLEQHLVQWNHPHRCCLHKYKDNIQIMRERAKMCVHICECTLPYSTPQSGEKANRSKEILCRLLLEQCISTKKSSSSKMCLNFLKLG